MSNISSEELMFEIADLFKVFSDSTRVRILSSLQEKELCVGELSASLNISQTAISHQLRILKQNHLVKNRRDGKSVIYSLADDHVKTIIDCASDHLKED